MGTQVHELWRRGVATVFRPFLSVFDRFPDRPDSKFVRRIKERTVFSSAMRRLKTAKTVKTADSGRRAASATRLHHDLVEAGDFSVFKNVTFGNCHYSLRSIGSALDHHLDQARPVG